MVAFDRSSNGRSSAAEEQNGAEPQTAQVGADQLKRSGRGGW
jgi:hypothetical protein